MIVEARPRLDTGGEWRARMGAVERVRPLAIAVGLYLLALAALLLFGLAIHYRAAVPMLEADEREYYDLATGILAGESVVSARRTLGFPLLIAGLRSLGLGFVALQAAVSAIYALAAPMLFLAVRRVSGSQGAGALAGAALAVWPPAVFFGTSLYSETAAAPVFLASLWLLPRAGSGRGVVTSCVLAGVVLGIAAHIRPMYLLFLPVLALILLVEEWRWRGAAARLAAVVAGFLLVVLPWSAYVSDRFDRPILLTSNGGETLAGGLTPVLLTEAGNYNDPVVGRAVWVGAGKWVPIHRTGYLSEQEAALPYEQVDPLLRERALTWVAENPGSAARLEASKLAYMWGVWPLMGNGAGQFLAGNLPTIALLLLAVVLLVRVPESRRPLARFWMLVLFVSGVALISWGSWRFRQPADAGLLAYCAVVLWTRYLVPGRSASTASYRR